MAVADLPDNFNLVRLSGRSATAIAKVFCFFFSKKKAFLPRLPLPGVPPQNAPSPSRPTPSRRRLARLRATPRPLSLARTGGEPPRPGLGSRRERAHAEAAPHQPALPAVPGPGARTRAGDRPHPHAGIPRRPDLQPLAGRVARAGHLAAHRRGGLPCGSAELADGDRRGRARPRRAPYLGLEGGYLRPSGRQKLLGQPVRGRRGCGDHPRVRPHHQRLCARRLRDPARQAGGGLGERRQHTRGHRLGAGQHDRVLATRSSSSDCIAARHWRRRSRCSAAPNRTWRSR